MDFYIKDFYDDFHEKTYSKLVIVCDQINHIHPLLEFDENGEFELSYRDAKITRENVKIKIHNELFDASKELFEQQLEDTKLVKITFNYQNVQYCSKIVVRQDLKRMYKNLRNRRQDGKEMAKFLTTLFIIIFLYLLL